MIHSVKYDILDFFPDCILPECPQQGEVHQHIFPKQQEIVDADTKHIYVQGGVGGGKTTAIAACVTFLMVAIPQNEGVVSRYNYDDLFDSAWKEIKNCIDRIVEKGIIPKPAYSKKTQGEHTQINFPHNGSELKAIQGKNWRRGLGSNKGVYWVDDALECLEEFFVGTDTSAGLLSRLRLPHVQFYKGVYDKDTMPHGALRGYVSTNPPPVNTFLHTLYGKKPGIHRIGNDTITWIQGETGDNPTTGANYAKGLIAVQQRMGRSANVIRRVIHGESIPAYGGKPVFGEYFVHEQHVSFLKYNQQLPLIRSWDFGYDHPSVIFANIFRCKYRTNHYLTLSEISEAVNLTVQKLYKDYVIPHTQKLYNSCKHILDCGDRAGYRNSSSNPDGRSDMKILIEEYGLDFRWRYMNLAPSLQYMRDLLQPDKPCPCGLQKVYINRTCYGLIGALEGGYKYPKHRNGQTGEKPTEDKFFADIACAWRYGAENYVRADIPWEDQKRLRVDSDNVQALQLQEKFDENPLAWLEQTDRDFLSRITS